MAVQGRYTRATNVTSYGCGMVRGRGVWVWPLLRTDHPVGGDDIVLCACSGHLHVISTGEVDEVWVGVLSVVLLGSFAVDSLARAAQVVKVG